MMERLSILGLTRYDPHIWDHFYLPSGANRQAAIDFILMQCGEMGLTYSQPSTVKEMIRIWSTTNQDGWARIWLAMTENYNPLHNYDRYEEWTDNSAGTSSGTAGSTVSGTESRTSSGTTGGTVTDKVAGFNQGAGLATKGEQTTSGTSSDTVTGSTSTTASGNNSNSTTDNSSHSGHLYGNIGVTTSATMLKEEQDIRQTSFYEIICKSFKDNFCVQVY